MNNIDRQIYPELRSTKLVHSLKRHVIDWIDSYRIRAALPGRVYLAVMPESTHIDLRSVPHILRENGFPVCRSCCSSRRSSDFRVLFAIRWMVGCIGVASLLIGAATNERRGRLNAITIDKVLGVYCTMSHYVDVPSGSGWLIPLFNLAN